MVRSSTYFEVSKQCLARSRRTTSYEVKDGGHG
jgi:hypothetical protein